MCDVSFFLHQHSYRIPPGLLLFNSTFVYGVANADGEAVWETKAANPYALCGLRCRQAIEHGISVDRGGVWLMLTGEQYGKLKGIH